MSKTREALEAALRDAMKKAFNFGQTYWQQADSHFVSQQNKSDITREAFNKLVNDIVRSVLAEPEQEPVTMHKVAEERDKLMQMVQEYASTWAIVGGRFDDGSALEDAKKSKDSIFRQTAKLATISFELGFDKERCVESSPQHSEPKKLWLWKNFVGGKAEYWAFENAYPIHIDNDDPQVIGEPCGYALYKPSRNSGVNRREPTPVAPSPQPRKWQELNAQEAWECYVKTPHAPKTGWSWSEVHQLTIALSATLRAKNEVKI